MLGGKRSIFDTIVQFLNEDGHRFEKMEDMTALKVYFKGDNASYLLLALANEEQHRASFYTVLSVNVPPEKRLAIAEFITRANFDVSIGNFEMDFSDGGIRYKTSVDIEDGQLVTSMVRTLMAANIYMMDKYYPGLMGVIYGNVSPADAIAKIKG